MTTSKKIGVIIVSTFLVGMVIAGLWKRYLLTHDFAYTTGTVTNITVRGYKSGGDYSILYEYVVMGKMYGSNNDYNYCHGQSIAGLKVLLAGKQFPVAYAVKDPSTSTLLITKKYADQFNYKLSDSARVYDSLLTCQ